MKQMQCSTCCFFDRCASDPEVDPRELTPCGTYTALYDSAEDIAIDKLIEENKQEFREQYIEFLTDFYFS